MIETQTTLHEEMRYSEVEQHQQIQKLRRKCIICSFACIGATAYLITFAMMAIFGLLNPDADAWVGKDPYGIYQLYPTEQAAQLEEATNYSHIH